MLPTVLYIFVVFFGSNVFVLFVHLLCSVRSPGRHNNIVWRARNQRRRRRGRWRRLAVAAPTSRCGPADGAAPPFDDAHWLCVTSSRRIGQ